MNAERDDLVKRAADQVTKDLAAQGKVIEGGWRALVIRCRLENAPPVQLYEMRRAYYAGAQHLFASIMTMLDPGTDATEADLHRMDLIHQELERYVQELKAQKTS